MFLDSIEVIIMITILSHKIDAICKELADYKRNTSKSSEVNLISWNQVTFSVLNLLCQYPAGVSNAIVLAELDMIFSAKYNRQGISSIVDKVGGIQSINDVVEYGQVSSKAVFQCKIANWFTTTNVNMKIIELQDIDEPRLTLSMYLHDKLDNEFFNILNTAECYVSDLKLHWKANEKKAIVLPTEYIIPIIKNENNYNLFNNFIKTKKTIDTILSNMEETALCNVRLEVIRKHPLETRSRIDGSIIKEQSIDLSDGCELISFSLFDQDITFNQMINIGDILFIENAILCASASRDKIHLEYGTPTLLYLKQFRAAKESLCSQMTGKLIGNIENTKSGRRNYYDAKSRTYLSDFNKDFENGSCLAVVEAVSKRDIANIEIRMVDESGNISVKLENIIGKDFLGIIPGDLLFFHGLSSQGGNVGIKYREGINVFNICKMQGYLASSHLYKVSRRIQNLSNGTFIIKGALLELITDLHFIKVSEEKDKEITAIGCSLTYPDHLTSMTAQIRTELSEPLQFKSNMSSDELIEVIVESLQLSQENEVVIALTVSNNNTFINSVQNYFKR